MSECRDFEVVQRAKDKMVNEPPWRSIHACDLTLIRVVPEHIDQGGVVTVTGDWWWRDAPGTNERMNVVWTGGG